MLFKINSKGRGPKEYISLANGFTLGDNSEIALFDVAYQRLFWYDREGKFMRTEPVDTKADAVVKLGDGHFASLIRVGSMFSNDKDCIKITDDEGRVVSSCLPLPRWISKSSLNQHGGDFRNYNDELLLLLPWSYQIFSIDQDEVKCKYLLDYGDLNIPVSFFEEHQDELGDMTTEIMESRRAASVEFFQESDGHVFFQTVIEANLYYTLFDKETKQTSTIFRHSFPDEWRIVMRQLLASHGNSFYCTIPLQHMDVLLKVSEINGLDDERLVSLVEEYAEYRQAHADVPDDHLVMLSFLME